MPRYTDIDKLIAEYDRVHIGPAGGARKLMVEAPIADVVPRAEVFEEVDKFRADLMNKFIDLCRGNDYNKLTLLKIGDVVDEMYDRRIAELENADVAPRAEVAREIFEEIEEYASTWCGDYYISIEKLEELKKKYTEVK